MLHRVAGFCFSWQRSPLFEISLMPRGVPIASIIVNANHGGVRRVHTAREDRRYFNHSINGTGMGWSSKSQTSSVCRAKALGYTRGLAQFSFSTPDGTSMRMDSSPALLMRYKPSPSVWMAKPTRAHGTSKTTTSMGTSSASNRAHLMPTA